jgi:hypothetical protein
MNRKQTQSVCKACKRVWTHRADNKPGCCSHACKEQRRREKLIAERRQAEYEYSQINTAPEGSRWLAVRHGVGFVFSLVDVDVFDSVCEIMWSLHTSGYHASYHHKGLPHVLLHHLVIGAPPDGLQVDHKNRNGLDNRKSNLRFATHKQNVWNARYSKERPGMRGVERVSNGWRASIQNQGRKIRVGTFSSCEAAARAYDQEARRLRGVFAQLNYPDEDDHGT